ncbi:MAG: GTP-binding protein, partial [Muribaculaceae bacterium]|nr:GTP-binding protein [Muribaculaceae bacterium]
MTMAKFIPVLLLTGYLGSGKTTLLNRILDNRRGIRFAVIVNDIGEVNIDAELIQKGGIVGQDQLSDDLVALQNGCICCTLRMDLVKQITDITKTGRFDYIVIEASGICEPAPIAQTICTIPQMAGADFDGFLPRLDCIATVVDALRLQSEFACGDRLGRKDIGDEDIENLIIQQMEFCNIILLNKISEVTADEAARIRAIIRALQPKAQIIDCDYCDVDLDRLLDTRLFDFEDVATSATWVRELEGPNPDAAADDHHPHDHHHEHHHAHEDGHGHEEGCQGGE